MRILFFMLCMFSAFAEEVDLSQYERSFYSQHGEDGVLSKIMHELDPTHRYFLEFGGKDKSTGHLSYFFKMQGWEGISLNRVYDKPKFMMFKEYATADNLFDLLKKHKAKRDVYLLIVDVNYNDFYIWKKIEEKYRPTVVVIKYNGTHSPQEDKVVKYHPFYCGDGTDYFGASIRALYNFGKAHGYSLVYADKSGAYLFFIRETELKARNLTFKNIDNVDKIYRYPTYGMGPKGGYRDDSNERDYITSAELIK